MNNPFENKDGTFLVLANDEGQHSLWPANIKVPAGWKTLHQGTRQECLDFVDGNWTDMRPKSLIAESSRT